MPAELLPPILQLMGFRCALSLDRRNQGLCAQDGNDPLEVVGQEIQAHFGTDARQGFRQEVGIAHPRLQRPKGTFDR